MFNEDNNARKIMFPQSVYFCTTYLIVYCYKCYNIVYLKDPINTFSNMLSKSTLITIAVTENAINGP